MYEGYSDMDRLGNLSELDSYELVAMAQAGDRLAFSELVDRYHKRVYNTIYSLVGNREDADDLTQDAFIKAYHSLSKFQNRSKFYTWIYRIAINCFRDWYKSARQHREVSMAQAQTDFGDFWMERFAGSDSSDDRVKNREFQEMLEQALSMLLPEFRETIVLRDIDGLTYPEIAEVLGCAVGTVKSRLFRGREQLKILWKTEYKARWEGVGT